jgi:hypothetical protein
MTNTFVIGHDLSDAGADFATFVVVCRRFQLFRGGGHCRQLKLMIMKQRRKFFRERFFVMMVDEKHKSILQCFSDFHSQVSSINQRPRYR